MWNSSARAKEGSLDEAAQARAGGIRVGAGRGVVDGRGRNPRHGHGTRIGSRPRQRAVQLRAGGYPAGDADRGQAHRQEVCRAGRRDGQSDDPDAGRDSGGGGLSAVSEHAGGQRLHGGRTGRRLPSRHPAGGAGAGVGFRHRRRAGHQTDPAEERERDRGQEELSNRWCAAARKARWKSSCPATT